MSIDQARIITAIKTPYKCNGKVDVNRFLSNIELQINGNVEGIVVAGTTGEGHLLSNEECIQLIQHAVRIFGQEIVIIGNTGGNSTSSVVKLTQAGFDVGMDASLQVNPYYGLTSPEGLTEHFDKVLELGKVILYNIPSRTGQSIPIEVIKHLSYNKNFQGIKECMGFERLNQLKILGVNVWSGDDLTFFDYYSAGLVFGTISVMANLIPNITSDVILGNNTHHNDKYYNELKFTLAEYQNPIAINAAMAMIDIANPVFKLPYVPPAQQYLDKLYSLLSSMYDDGILFHQPRKLNREHFSII
ncbi:hypothetical protein TUMSATVNIG1_57800 (plasmid) [Vibrio nigripulchritudo]|uniref:dihydrodipicolinate synthase family protein n=1 Tax=Vibrio nigripulchritudo TaxID=28173 RepID=UPI00190E4D8C|nr:dihydrodipicolinate synthase family protein [Vibrio nigripulchritudo]BCL73794.1 hypothetical protein VNTUMSATTG_57310 [Vibrio nigripulchritudo]BDU35171.1 hypothetical protein TUMSATVNIG1_57800 [Vibrio nigripulchritudo]